MKTAILYFLVVSNLLLVLGLGYMTREINLAFSEKLVSLDKKINAWSPIKYEDSDIIELDLNELENLKKIGEKNE